MFMIRAAKPEDIPQLVTLLKILFTLEADFEIDSDKQTSGLAQLLNSDGAYVLVAVTQQKIAGLPQKVIGMCSVQTLISTAEGGRVGFLEDLVVAPEYRHQGIATNLLAQVRDWAASAGLKRLQLLADKHNHPALAFYAQKGWESTQLVCLRKR